MRAIGPLIACAFAVGVVLLAAPMDAATIVGLLCIGAVMGGLIVAAWMSDRDPTVEPTEHGGTPL